MEIGLKHYEVPVLSVKQKGKDIVTLVDTGASNNMIAEHTLQKMGSNVSMRKMKSFSFMILWAKSKFRKPVSDSK
jgi:predicted aspartyl protease